MPSDPGIQGENLEAILKYLHLPDTPPAAQVRAEVTTSKTEASSSGGKEAEAKYNFTGYRKFLDPEGFPAIVPPWGTLNAIDLNTGNICGRFLSVNIQSSLPKAWPIRDQKIMEARSLRQEAW